MSVRIQSLSPLKKRIQDLNTNLIKNMNESYQEAALLEAKNLGEGTAEYNKNQQNLFSGSFNAGRPMDNYGMQPRIGGFRHGVIGGSGYGTGENTMMFSNKQLLLSKT